MGSSPSTNVLNPDPSCDYFAKEADLPRRVRLAQLELNVVFEIDRQVGSYLGHYVSPVAIERAIANSLALENEGCK